MAAGQAQRSTRVARRIDVGSAPSATHATHRFSVALVVRARKFRTRQISIEECPASCGSVNASRQRAQRGTVDLTSETRRDQRRIPFESAFGAAGWLKDLNERAVAAEADAIEIEVNNAGDLDRALRRADSSSTTGYIAMTEAIDTTAAAVATGNLTYWISLYSYGHQ